MKRILLILFILLWAGSAWGATYYVSNAETNGYAIGNNANTTAQAQSKATPWLTLVGANTAASDGDTIYVNAGTYAEDQTTGDAAHCFNPTKAITWRAVDGEVIVRKGAGGGVASAFYVNADKTVLLTGTFSFDAEGVASRSSLYFGATANGITLDGIRLKGAAGYDINYTAGCTNIILTNITDDNTTPSLSVIQGSPGVGSSITASTFNTSSGYFALLGNSSTLTFGGSGTNKNAVTATVSSNFWDYNGTNITLTDQGNTYNITSSGNYLANGTRSSKTGTISHLNNTYSYNTSADNSFSFTTPGAWTLNFSGNTVTPTNAAFAKKVVNVADQAAPLISENIITVTAQHADHLITPISVTSTGTDMTASPYVRVTNNTVTTNNTAATYGIQVGTDGTTAGNNKIDNAIITGNKLYGVLYSSPGSDATGWAQHGILYGFNKNGTIANNLIWGFPLGISVKGAGDTWSAGGVNNNLWIDNAAANQTSIGVRGQQHVPVYNNTIVYTSALHASNFNKAISIITQDASDAHGCVVKNNIVYANSNQIISTDAASEVDAIYSNNVYYNWNTGNAIRFSTDGGTTFDHTFADWQGVGHTHDTSGTVNADPRFHSATDFHLSAGSPAINAGVGVGLTTDYDGKPIRGLPDIGAYEYYPSSRGLWNMYLRHRLNWK